MILSFHLSLFVLGFVPQGFNGTDDGAVVSFDRGGRKPAPFTGLSYTGKKYFGFVGLLNEYGFAPFFTV